MQNLFKQHRTENNTSKFVVWKLQVVYECCIVWYASDPLGKGNHNIKIYIIDK